MKFIEYNFAPELKRSLEELDWKRPTDIQHKAITPTLNGEDVLAIAQTGTGKTAAFVLPILQKLLNKSRVPKHKSIRCVVMAPTHELAQQITEVFKSLSKYTKIRILCIHGGVAQAPQIEMLDEGVDILVATPGRIFDLRSQGYIILDHVDTLVLDEADHMLDLGFIKDIEDLIKYLPKNRQTLFYSATINEVIKRLAYSLVRNAIRIQISPKDPVARNVNHSVAFIEMDDKRFFLERLIKENPDSKILVFVRTKVRAERVKSAMERANIASLTIHGDKDQRDRNSSLGAFRTGECKILIATDVSARGIDIPNVEYVINYDLPEQSENYVHRVGRTGRGKHKGQAVSFCSKEELPILSEIETYLGKSVQELEIAKRDYNDTIEFTKSDDDWKSLMKSANVAPSTTKGRKHIPKKKKR